MIAFEKLQSTRYDALGYIPHFIDAEDPRPVKEQIDFNYISGWHKMNGFTLDPKSMSLRYPGDQPMKPVAKAVVRDETVYVYPHAWVLIMQQDNSFEVARLD